MVAVKKKVIDKSSVPSLGDEVATELPKVKKAIFKALGKASEFMPERFDVKHKKASLLGKAQNYVFGFGDGVKTIIAEDEGVLEITDIGRPNYSLKDWNLWITDLDVIPLEGKIGKNVHLPVGMKRGILMGPDGYRVDFCNIAEITLLPEDKKVPTKIESDHLFLANVTDDAKDWLVTIESSNILNLNNMPGVAIPVSPDSCGILAGPGGNVLTFSHIKKIILPKV